MSVLAVEPPAVVEGTRSTAEQASDGTWTIRGVPLFAEHVARSPNTGKAVPVDRAWLTKCVERQQAEYAQNRYLPRLHVNHHDFGDDAVEPAGFFLPTRVASAAVRGGETLAIYGDLVGIPPEVYARIRSKALPYLSCEANLDTVHLESCALLPTRPPVHKFTPLTIGVERKATQPNGNFLRDPAEVVECYASSGDGVRVLTRIAPPMTDAEKKAADEAAAANASGTATSAANTPAGDATTKNADGSAKPVETPEKPAATAAVEEKPAVEKAAETPAAPPAPAIPDAMVMTVLTGVMAVVTEMKAMLAKALEPKSDDTPGAPPPINGTGSTAYADGAAKQVGELVAKVSILEADAAAAKAKSAADAEIGAVSTRLSRYASRIPNIGAQIRDLHAKAGNAGIVAYADLIEKTVSPVASDSTLDGATGGEGGVALAPELLAKYGARGVGELEAIAKLSRSFAANGGVAAHQMSLTDYVDLELRLEARNKALAAR